MIDIAVLRAMAAAGATVEMILAAVEASQASRQDALARRRASDAGRQKNLRAREATPGHVMSRDPSTPNVMSRDPETPLTPPPMHILPPQVEIKPKRVLSAKAAIPVDFRLSDRETQFCRDRGWSSQKIGEEFGRFCDHAKANNRKQADWAAAWRNWVTSPYQKPKDATNGHQSARNCSDVARELADQFGGEAHGIADRLLPQDGRD